MVKKGMKRPERTQTQPKNQTDPVPELQGKAKHTKKHTNPIVTGTFGTDQRVFHGESPIPVGFYSVINNMSVRFGMATSFSNYLHSGTFERIKLLFFSPST